MSVKNDRKLNAVTLYSGDHTISNSNINQRLGIIINDIYDDTINTCTQEGTKLIQVFVNKLNFLEKILTNFTIFCLFR